MVFHTKNSLYNNQIYNIFFNFTIYLNLIIKSHRQWHQTLNSMNQVSETKKYFILNRKIIYSVGIQLQKQTISIYQDQNYRIFKITRGNIINCISFYKIFGYSAWIFFDLSSTLNLLNKILAQLGMNKLQYQIISNCICQSPSLIEIIKILQNKTIFNENIGIIYCIINTRFTELNYSSMPTTLLRNSTNQKMQQFINKTFIHQGEQSHFEMK
ncbi:hypothetical protein pb186bvf_005139 [Paramecium bursaria]